MEKCKLICGDCFEVLPHLDKVDFIFTSPPYNRKRNDKYKNYDDSLDDYYKFLETNINLCLTKANYVFYNLQKNYYNKKDIYNIIGHFADKIIDIVCWAKSNPLPASGFNITNSYEFILILSEKQKSIKATQTYTKNFIETSVYSENPYKKIHRAVMKPDICNWFVNRFTTKDDVICDPFMGLGTTGISVLSRGGYFVGIEKDKEYFDIAKQRLTKNLISPTLFRTSSAAHTNAKSIPDRCRADKDGQLSLF